MEKERECLNCRKISDSLPRGLCRLCYQRSYYRVRQGLTSWEKLDAEGLARFRQRRKIGIELPDLDKMTEEYLCSIRREIATEVIQETFSAQTPLEDYSISELLRILAERMERK